VSLATKSWNHSSLIGSVFVEMVSCTITSSVMISNFHFFKKKLPLLEPHGKLLLFFPFGTNRKIFSGLHNQL
jgi:hypothetical protein